MEKKKNLVVDDEYSINDALAFSFRKEGYEVRSALNGEEALELLRIFKPDLVLLDLMLPDISGFDICKQISENTYVIMVTARGQFIDKMQGLELGADDYIVKPFKMKEVLLRVKVIFRRADKENNNKLEEKENKLFNGIEVLSNNRKVMKEGIEVPLRRKEFDLLNFLYKNRGRVFSREELLGKVWGYDYEGDTGTVDVHIRRIRIKLNEDKDNSTIKTVFGVGYVVR